MVAGRCTGVGYGEGDDVGEVAIAGPWALGCQVRPWVLEWGKGAFPRRLPEAVADLVAAGFTGFETRLDYLPLDDPAGFAALPRGVALCGAHIGGKWWSSEGAASIPGIVARAARLPALGCRRLVVSMAALPPGATADDLSRFVDTLGHLGRACREVGVAVVAHNHASELADDARVLTAIVERCAPEDIALGPDLGWVAHVGLDLSAFLRHFAPRIAYLHARDVTVLGRAGNFIEVGRGVLDWPAILATLADVGYVGWLVAESESQAEGYSAGGAGVIARTEARGLRAALVTAKLTSRLREDPEAGAA